MPNGNTPMPTNDCSVERWAQIPGHEQYEVSTLGAVRSWMECLPSRRITLPHCIKPSARPDGRLQVTLYDVKPARSHKVHVLVALTFLGPRPDGYEVRHLNGDHTNNSVSNLAYGTPSDNRQDQMFHGTHWQVQKSHCPSGHLYDEANTLINRKGHRICRACNRAACRARYQRRTGKVA